MDNEEDLKLQFCYRQCGKLPCEIAIACKDFYNYIMGYRKCERDLNPQIEELKTQIEKMKNFQNCSHSSRALCPNNHNCEGCKDWELEK